MADTSVAEPDAGLSPAQLAARYGLGVAGATPSLAAYSRQLWSYRHFITTYARAKLVASFGQARLGQLWQVLTPLTNAAVYFLIFGIILGTRSNIHNFIAYLCIGLFVYTFTQNVVTGGVASITGNLGLIRALHFPRACLPIAMTLTQLEHLATAMVVLLAIVLITGEPVTLEWFLVIPAMLLQAIFNAGLALMMARLGAKLTDLKQLMPFVMRTWMYTSGVFYSVDLFAKHLSKVSPILTTIAHANPLLIYIEMFREALLEKTTPFTSPSNLWIGGVVWAVVMGVAGFVYFWRGEQEYGRG